MNALTAFLHALLALLLEMAPWLLFGFLAAGVLHVFVPGKIYRRFLSGRNFRSVFWAAMLGVPLPLCSCGVIPTGMGLRKDGASRGASVSFLISTPQTGIDSILATWALLGLPFAVIRPLAAFLTGILGGTLVNCLIPEDALPEPSPECADENRSASDTLCGASFLRKISIALHYGFVEMMQDIGKWLTLGLAVAAGITVLVPDGFLASLSEKTPLFGMLAILLLAVPMYVCATGSIPIAAALIAKGVSPGAAFVLLMAGPATNAAAMLIVGKVLGRKTLAIYLSAIFLGAIASGLAIDLLCPPEWFTLNFSTAPDPACCCGGIAWWKAACAALLGLLLLNALIFRRDGAFSIRRRSRILAGSASFEAASADSTVSAASDPVLSLENRSQDPQMKGKEMSENISQVRNYRVNGMTCNHCRNFVERSIRSVSGVEDVNVSLSESLAVVFGPALPEDVIHAVEDAGFEIQEI